MKYNNVKLEISCYLKKQLPSVKKKEIVFVGRSNVGKSSIINKILNRKGLARVSNTPGKTVSINFYSADFLYFVDFPGYGFAKIDKNKKKIWDVLADKYFSSGRRIVFAVLVLDARRGFKELDFNMVKYLLFKKINFIVLINKIDKLKKIEIKNVLEKVKKDLININYIEIILSSCKTKKGIATLKRLIEKLCIKC